MNDPYAINRSIDNIMSQFIIDEGYADYVLFQSKVMISNDSIMFTMMLKEGLLKVEPFKAVFPIGFLRQCDEDSVVNMICDMFKGVVRQCEKLDKKNEDDCDNSSAFRNGKK